MNQKPMPKVPEDFPVKVLKPGQHAEVKATCGTCGRSWDDNIITEWTPAPSARCPFEYFHEESDPTLEEVQRDTLRETRDDLINALNVAAATIERLQQHAPGSAIGTLDVIRNTIARAKPCA